MCLLGIRFESLGNNLCYDSVALGPTKGHAQVNDSSDSSEKERKGPIFQDIARFRGILFDTLLKPHDLTMSQGWVLVHAARESGMTQSELASRLEVATVTTSKLIDRLEDRGFLERRSDPTDRRSNRIYTTSKADAAIETMSETVRQVDSVASAGIDDVELATALQVLEKMRKNLREALASHT